MSDLISRSKIYNYIKAQINPFGKPFEGDVYEFGVKLMGYIEQMDTEESVTDTNVGGRWIPCSDKMLEEHESIFAKWKGTDKWRRGMFESISDDVNVTVELEDGTRKTQTSHTVDGNWSCEKDYGIKRKVVAWMPLPEPYKGE